MIIRLIILYGLYVVLSILHEVGHRLFLVWGHYPVKDWRIGSAPWILHGLRWHIGIFPGMSHVTPEEPIQKVGHRLGMSLSGVGLVTIVIGVAGSLLWSVTPIILIFGATTVFLDMMPWPPIMDGAKTMNALRQSDHCSPRLTHSLCVFWGGLMSVCIGLGVLLIMLWIINGRF